MQSDTIGKLAEALAKAQGVMDNPPRSANNPFFKSKYAPLSAITDAIRAPLSANGLSYTQVVEERNGIIMLVTRLMHVSGEWLESAMPLPHVGKPQEFGSVLTYFRRYQLSAIVGITADDDDDGNAASGVHGDSNHAPQNGKQEPTDNPFDGPAPQNGASEKQHKMLFALGKKLYGDNWDEKRAVLVKAITNGRTDSAKELTGAELSRLLDGLKKKKQTQEAEKVPA